jgi:hypothetical protein
MPPRHVSRQFGSYLDNRRCRSQFVVAWGSHNVVAIYADVRLSYSEAAAPRIDRAGLNLDPMEYRGYPIPSAALEPRARVGSPNPQAGGRESGIPGR